LRVTDDATHSARPTWPREAFAVALVLLAATGMRVISLPHEAVWHDEIATLAFLDAPTLGEFLRQTHAVTPVPPGYSITQYYWSRAFGDSVLALRMLSLAYGVAGLAALYGLGRAMFSHRAGLIATAWMAFVFWHIYHSQEIRFYAMITLLAILMMWAFVRFVTRPGPASFALHAAVSAVTIWTHPFTVLLFAAMGLFLLAFRWGRWRLIAAWSAAHIALAGSLVAFLASIDRGVAYAQAGWLSLPTLWRGYPSVRGFLAMGAGLMDHPPANDLGAMLITSHGTLWLIVELFTLLGFFAAVILLTRKSLDVGGRTGLNPRESGVLLALWFVVPPVLAFVGSYAWQPMFQGRYLLFAYPPLYLALGWLLSRRAPVLVALAFAPIILFDALFYFPGPFRAPYDRAVEMIKADPEPVRDVYIDDMIAKSAIEYYWTGPAPGILSPLEMEDAVDIRAGEVRFQAPSNWLLLSDEKRARYMRIDLRRSSADFEVHYFLALRPLWLFHVTSPPLPETPGIIDQQ
jgi:hypothetical protein